MTRRSLIKWLRPSILSVLFVLSVFYMARTNWESVSRINVFTAALDTGSVVCGLLLCFASAMENYSYYNGGSLLPPITGMNTFVLLLDIFGICMAGSPQYERYIYWGSALFLILVYGLSTLFLLYYLILAEVKTKWRNIILAVALAFGVFMLTLLALNVKYHFLFSVTADIAYQRERLAFLVSIFPLLVLFSAPILLLPAKSIPRFQKNAISLSSVISVFSIPLLLQLDKITIIYSSTMVSVIIFYYSVYLRRGVDLVIKRKLLLEKQMEIAREQQKIMLSQIQPHFIFNTLGSIAHLCKKNPEKAYDTTNDFAEYMRHNLESLTGTPLVSFEKELDHVKKYLSIEQTRFGSSLSVIYDIGPRNFQVPVLSIQPLVENAVKHGLLKKKGGGTLLLRTEDAGKNYLITIKDDGIGFNPDTIQDDGKNHVGIANVKLRLEGLCSAIMGIISVPREGTTVLVFIPKE